MSVKGGLNEISRKYGERFPETLLKPITYRIEELEKKIKRLQEIAVSPKDENLLETKMVEYNDVREKLMKNLDMLEIKAIQNLQKSNESLKLKSLDINRKSTTEYSILVAVICYVILIFILAFITYLSIAAPLAKLEGAATQSIQNRENLICVEEGPEEVRSLTRRLQGLILGLEDAVKDRDCC